MRYSEILVDQLEETSTAGGTSAGSVATVTGTIGSGFGGDPKASIYYKKEKVKEVSEDEDEQVIIRRPSPISKK